MLLFLILVVQDVDFSAKARRGVPDSERAATACENPWMFLDLPDPRALSPIPAAAALPALVAAGLGMEAAASAASDAADHAVDSALSSALDERSGATLSALFAASPSVAVYRHLWRRLVAVTARPRGVTNDLALTLFALPLVVITARDSEAGDGAVLTGTVGNPAALAALLREHHALGGSENFVLADALVSAHAIDIAALPGLYGDATAALDNPALSLNLPPSPISVGLEEAVHLRFLVGTALSTPRVRLLDGAAVGAWGMPLAQRLSRELALAGTSVLVLPRAPASLPDALNEGRKAQREISAQLFVGNALRRLRAAFGEPTAILSAHRTGDGGGELRLSLSSPFSPRDAEGFRCPLLPAERVADVTAMLADLLSDCRLEDVRAVPGVQPDRDAATGIILLFKPETMPGAAEMLPPALN
jgi:hypothetical protein